jgi:hypothetical protein
MRPPGRYEVTPGDIALLPNTASADFAEVVWMDVDGNGTTDLRETVEIRIVFRTNNGAVVATVYGSPS